MDARKLVIFALPLVVACACACDNKDRNEQIVATEKKDAEDPELEKKMAERKAKREADAKAKEAAAEAKRVEIAKLAVVPDKPPKSLEKGCEEVAAAHDRFMQRTATGDALGAWTAAKENELPMTIVQCASSGSVQVAGCQAHALDNATPELKDDVKAILQACLDEFGPKGPPPGVQQGGGSEIPKIPKKK